MSAAESQPNPTVPPARERERPLLEEGAQVGRYRILKRLGAGAMGEVYLGVDESLGRRAAIKVLGGRHLANPTVKERFLREARALARHAHPNLITVFESGQLEKSQRPYYAMELLEGGDTQKLLEERGPLPSGVVAIIGAEAAAGLGEAARAHIIHRDVKPANLGISAHGVLKVTDFGLAKSHAGEHKSLTGEGFVVGTADYIAPEQARGEQVDERADVYALGCTLFHLLTGRPPFRSAGKTEVQRYADVMRAHLNQPVPDPRVLAPETDPELGDLVMKLMDKQREERPTFEEAAPLLARIAARLGGELPRVTRKLFTLPTGAPALIPSIVEPAPALVSPPPRWHLIGATCALVMSAVALVIAIFHR
jgi:serine/threonine protein kinase